MQFQISSQRAKTLGVIHCRVPSFAGGLECWLLHLLDTQQISYAVNEYSQHNHDFKCGYSSEIDYKGNSEFQRIHSETMGPTLFPSIIFSSGMHCKAGFRQPVERAIPNICSLRVISICILTIKFHRRQPRDKVLTQKAKHNFQSSLQMKAMFLCRIIHPNSWLGNFTTCDAFVVGSASKFTFMLSCFAQRKEPHLNKPHFKQVQQLGGSPTRERLLRRLLRRIASDMSDCKA